MELVPILDGSALLELPPETRSTTEESPGRPTTYRYFPAGPAVYGASLELVDGPDPVSAAAGSLIAAYRRREGYSRTSHQSPVIEGADEAALLEFGWQDRNGVEMRSFAVVASVGERVVVVYGTLPSIHGETAAMAVRDTVLSLRLGELTR